MQPRVQFQLHGNQFKQVDTCSLFYLSVLGQPETCLRGWQPVIFPQFADQSPLKKHGFARDVAWEVFAEEHAYQRHRVILARKFVLGEVEGWSHEACLSLDVESVPGLLSQALEVSNTGHSEFAWTGGLHPYFAVGNLQLAKLSGLVGVPYTDRYQPGQAFSGKALMGWTEEPCEKLFKGAPALTLYTGPRLIKLETSGFDQWMVWNPGVEGAKSIADLPDEDWNRLVCIEPVCVDRPIYLEPGQKFVGKFDISFSPDDFPDVCV